MSLSYVALPTYMFWKMFSSHEGDDGDLGEQVRWKQRMRVGYKTQAASGGPTGESTLSVVTPAGQGVEILCFRSAISSQSSFPYLSLFMLLGPLSHSNPLISHFLNHNLSHVLRLLKMCPGVRMKIIGPVITFICRS